MTGAVLTEESLRALYGAPHAPALAKVIHAFDDHCRAFIANAPFLVMATGDGTTLDASPKGDAPGFVAVLDERRIAIPDRPGNNRIDGLLNILRRPEVALLFFIPGVGETLRVNGRAEVSADPDLCARFPVNGKLPRTVTVVTMREAFLHCGKALMRSGLWRTETWPAERPVGGLGDIIRDHSGIDVPYKTEELALRLYRDTLY